jgi:hypothetical protein
VLLFLFSSGDSSQEWVYLCSPCIRSFSYFLSQQAIFATSKNQALLKEADNLDEEQQSQAEGAYCQMHGVRNAKTPEEAKDIQASLDKTYAELKDIQDRLDEITPILVRADPTALDRTVSVSRFLFIFSHFLIHSFISLHRRKKS